MDHHDHGWWGVMGFFVGYMGYNSHKRTTNNKRRECVDFDLDTDLLPCFMNAK